MASFRILSDDDLAYGLGELNRIDPLLARVQKDLPPIPLRNRPPGFAGIAGIVIAQQVSEASAKAVFGRLSEAIQPLNAQTFLAAGAAVWVEAGLIRARQASLKGVAEAMVEERLDLNGLCDLEIEEAYAQLTAYRGIGPWTAQIFLMCCAGHPDVFASGDVALRHAISDLYDIDVRRDARAANTFAERWKPWRSVASRILWTHYSTSRGRAVLPV